MRVEKYLLDLEFNDLDKKILPLVVALNQLSIRTTASCQGHANGWMTSRYHFPWVAIFEEDLDKVLDLIADYNANNEIKWVISLNGPSKSWLLKPKKDHRSLKLLQKEAIRLANFLFNIYEVEC